MHLHEIKGTRDLVSMHKDVCRSCGLCCHIQPIISIGNLKFIPVVEKLEGIDEIDKEMLALQVCENLDTETKKCKIYETRPLVCRKFFCKGNPRAQKVYIQGEGFDRKD